jgi:O-antigen/teichoic acid export membrane protein
LRSAGVIAVIAVPVLLIFVGAGHLLLDKAFGKDFALADKALPILGAAMTMLALSYLAVQYLLALHRSRFILLMALAAILDPLLLLAAGTKLTSIAAVLLALQLVLAGVMTVVALRARAVAGELEV